MSIVLTLAILAVAIFLFVTEKLRVDVVALIVLASVLVLGLVKPHEALAGFSNEATITVAAMFVLSAGLGRSGALQGLGRVLARSRRPTLALLGILLVVGPASAFINNTAAVAVLIPVVLTAAAAAHRAPSKFLIPLSYLAQVGGVCTLVGTSTNLLVNSLAIQAGHSGFSLFEFSGLGVVFLLVGAGYLVLTAPWLLPNRTVPSAESHETGKYVTDLRVTADSSLIGRTVADARTVEQHRVYVLALIRDEERHWEPRLSIIAEGDTLLVQGDWSRLMAFADTHRLTLAKPRQGDSPSVLIEAMVPTNSRLAGHTLKEIPFLQQHEAQILAVHRRGEILRDRIQTLPLAVGDLVLLALPARELPALRRDSALVVVSEREAGQVDWPKAMTSVGILAAVILAAGLGWLPIVAAALLGCIALVLLGCLTPDEAYEAIDWRVIVLLAGVFPLGIAIQTSGLADWLVTHTLAPLGSVAPLLALGALYLCTALLTEVMSNNAAAVLLTPIALGTAATLGVDAKPFLIAVMFAASTAFATPVGYQTNTMVYGAGGYRFTDFLKIGLPLNLLFLLLAILAIPRYFPFSPPA